MNVFLCLSPEDVVWLKYAAARLGTDETQVLQRIVAAGKQAVQDSLDALPKPEPRLSLVPPPAPKPCYDPHCYGCAGCRDSWGAHERRPRG